MGWFSKKPPKQETVTVTQTVTLKNPPRPVRSDVVDLLDNAIAAVGSGELMHAFDPARLATFADGGPPVWSVGTIPVAGPRPYTLFVTYGFSHALSPEPSRANIHHELSFAVPQSCETHPWAVALLRHLARYVLNTGNELMVGDVMPCRAPITCIPFPPQHHGMMPATDLDSVVVGPDPVLRSVTTPYGAIEVRRILGVTEEDLHRVGGLRPPQRVETWLAEDPLLLTTIS